ncbi:dienelactone hydrolase family protein [Nocardioides massiliensis]|uniref:Dienelactone hydrolase domain-containing protein n=1 Tax=Nocardioides massiliensis TaxID=1325935 RepID=A0ABT9NTG9_9ACTN|nr:dienelactone hydrolase family protein [Nocardioides massiliensis]MDP9823718.1 hypothetical protein [Nocardioides massiliensis]
MSVDVRIDPEVTTETVGGVEVRISALLLGGIPRGAAVVLAGPGGMRPVEAVDTMNALAQHGYESVMAEPAADACGDALGTELVARLVERVAARDWTLEQTGLIGYGEGARLAMLAAARTTFGAAVSVPRERADILAPEAVALRTPWLGMTGLGPGRHASAELVAHERRLSDASTQHVSLVGYPGVEHCLQDSVDGLAHQAVFDSWQRTVEWLNIHVAPRPTPLIQAWDEREALDRTPRH